jgi:hypothetical protein
MVTALEQVTSLQSQTVGHMTWPEVYCSGQPLFEGFGLYCRTVTLVNTSTVTIILCYCIILVITITIIRSNIYTSLSGIAATFFSYSRV